LEIFKKMDKDLQTKEKKKTLSDIASDCLILILKLRSTNNLGDSSSLKIRVNELFEKFERDARVAGIDNEKIRLAKFALVAFLDETIISSEWNQKDDWLSEPLQIKMFDTFNAGEEFFTYMHDLRQQTGRNKEVLEIFYLCLSLGFKGKYQLQSPENLRRVIDDLNLELHPEMYSTIDAISPNGKPKDTFIQAATGGIPLWVYPAAALVLFIIFYIIMSLSISGSAENVAESLKSLAS
jgi:type VI secretion system protein ImpK